MFFDGNDFAFGFSDNSKKTIDSNEGFLKGNMFDDEYEPYKNMMYFKINPKNEREKLLYKIMEVSFAINDLNLYLDLHPEDKNVYEEFKMYTKKCIELKDMYSKKYGSITLENTYDNYNWGVSPWPWDDMGGSMYV